jgi:hypothetical protein
LGKVVEAASTAPTDKASNAARASTNGTVLAITRTRLPRFARRLCMRYLLPMGRPNLTRFNTQRPLRRETPGLYNT